MLWLGWVVVMVRLDKGDLRDVDMVRCYEVHVIHGGNESQRASFSPQFCLNAVAPASPGSDPLFFSIVDNDPPSVV